MITITPNAHKKLTAIMRDPAAGHLRVAVVRGPHGCIHGWRLGLEEEAAAEDLAFEAEGINVLLERDIADTLQGAVIDYREDATAVGFTIELAHDPVPDQGHRCAH